MWDGEFHGFITRLAYDTAIPNLPPEALGTYLYIRSDINQSSVPTSQITTEPLNGTSPTRSCIWNGQCLDAPQWLKAFYMPNCSLQSTTACPATNCSRPEHVSNVFQVFDVSKFLEVHGSGQPAVIPIGQTLTITAGLEGAFASCKLFFLPLIPHVNVPQC
jgi:hypothetical protein